jgi:hypothetical protein
LRKVLTTVYHAMAYSVYGLPGVMRQKLLKQKRHGIAMPGWAIGKHLAIDNHQWGVTLYAFYIGGVKPLTRNGIDDICLYR